MVARRLLNLAPVSRPLAYLLPFPPLRREEGAEVRTLGQRVVMSFALCFLMAGNHLAQAPAQPPMEEPVLPPPQKVEGPDLTPGAAKSAPLPPREMSGPDPAPGAAKPAPIPPLRLADAIALSLANVETVKANVAVQSATVARFEALKQFVPLVDLPVSIAAFRNFSPSNTNVIFPDFLGGTPLTGQPGLDHAALHRVRMFFPLDPSGQITALPIAEEGIRAKVLMEQLIRRSQAMLAIQDYFGAKQIEYGIQVAQLGLYLAKENLGRIERKLQQKQAHDVEVTEARVNFGRAQVLLADLVKNELLAQRDLAVVLHRSRLLTPQEHEPIPIELDHHYIFLLDDPDLVELGFVPDFPTCRDEAIQLAKRQRVEVRLLVVGLRIARLTQQRSVLGLLGKGTVPTEMSFKNTTPGNGGVALGAVFGATYGLPLLDIGLWSRIREARLDVVQSQLELERALIDVGADAGNSWDRWQQAIKEWEQRERELDLRRELLERLRRLLAEKQVIFLDVLGAEVNWLQADANRWTAWFNLQLARLDVLRSTELLLDYVERAKIAKLTAHQQPPPEGLVHRWLPWLSSKKATYSDASEKP